MPSFLSHLVQRALQPQPALQPRIASRFEAVAVPSQPVGDDGFAELNRHDRDLTLREGMRDQDRVIPGHVSAAAPKATGVTPRARTSRSNVSTAASAAPAPNAAHDATASSPAPFVAPPPSAEAAPAATRAPGSARPPDGIERSVAPSPKPNGERVAPRDLSVPSVSETRRAAEMPGGTNEVDDEPASRPPIQVRSRPVARAAVPGAVVPIPVVPAVRVATARPSGAATPERMHELPEPRREGELGGSMPARHSPSIETRARPAHVGPGTASSTLLQPIVAEPRVATPRTPRQPRSGAGDAPAIHVTIGRVEVRATVASPPTRPSSPNKPALGLDEYLRQRNGAAR